MTAPRGIKIQEGEKITPENVARVIELLNSKEKPITKKDACDILNIKYNASRLAKIIEEYESRLAYETSRRKANRNKELSDLEIKEILESYFAGESLSKIAERLFRTPVSVKKILNTLNLIPEDYEDIPEERLKDEYSKGEIVFSIKYNEVCSIENKWKNTTELGVSIYNIYLTESDKYAYQSADTLIYLGDLVEKYKLNIKVTKYDAIAVKELISEGIRNARNKGKKYDDE
jgi:predicted DNA-binding protein